MDRHEFIGACNEGGRALDRALRRVVDECWDVLVREANRDLRNLEAARDLAQETIVRAWSRCKQFRGNSELLAWMRSILRHALLDSVRSRRDEVPLLDDDGTVADEVEDALRMAAHGRPLDPAAFASHAQSMQIYDACYARFAAAHPREAMVLRWVAADDMTLDELAGVLQRSPGATREFLSQCRKKARTFLAPWYALVRDGV